ncbi:MAG: pitrilysin family protein, partial [Alphaproteobacteria bacterium]|nr:pitrilysin family protein [Alphaproteobacteria bacterium]
MHHIEKFVLSNGLTFIVEEDSSTPMVAFNTVFKVGAKYENAEKTGLAHFFEHLMFTGSLNIPHYDTNLQKVGGDNNAFTTNDYTNYYCTLPAVNIETAFWLESDRMLSLAFNDKSFETQKKVVCEEFYENYINNPYGNVWQIMRNMAYQNHPYQWMTIGKDPQHIEQATLAEVKDFYFKYYRPNNAIISIVGNVKLDQIKALAEKWYSQIPNSVIEYNIPVELEQLESKKTIVKSNVPQDLIMLAWKTVSRLSSQFYTLDLVSDILGSGQSSRVYQSLIKDQKLFSSAQCFHLGHIDPSLIVISGKLLKGVNMETAESAILDIVNQIKIEPVEQKEITKIANKIETIQSF